MKNLIIYATKHGCSEKAAELLLAKVGGETILVNVVKQEAPALKGFDNVMIGGPVYFGSLPKKLTAYISSNLDALLEKRTGLFICAAQTGDEAQKELENVFPAALRGRCAAKAVFGHELDFKKLNFLEKLMVRMVKGATVSEFALDEAKIAEFALAMSLQ